MRCFAKSLMLENPVFMNNKRLHLKIDIVSYYLLMHYFLKAYASSIIALEINESFK
ncbi:hypothetical protein JCM17380_40320 [Desulfosporosinus burensis]